MIGYEVINYALKNVRKEYRKVNEISWCYSLCNPVSLNNDVPPPLISNVMYSMWSSLVTSTPLYFSFGNDHLKELTKWDSLFSLDNDLSTGNILKNVLLVRNYCSNQKRSELKDACIIY